MKMVEIVELFYIDNRIKNLWMENVFPGMLAIILLTDKKPINLL
jgi:hypothetical protein